MTDVTGFGFLGHLLEMCEGSGLSAEIEYAKVPRIDCIQEYIDQGSMPGATRTNWQNVQGKVKLANEDWKAVLCDPQTSGGLLVAVEADSIGEVENIFRAKGVKSISIGTLIASNDAIISVK